MIEQTNLAWELCPLMGVAASPAWGQVPSNKHPREKEKKKKSPIFAQQLETEEPLGSRILVGYDNAQEGRAWQGGGWGVEKGGGVY